MPDLNTYSCTGRVGRDPEFRTVGESELASFSLGIDASYKKRDGTKVDRTTWLDCTVWGGLCNVIRQYVNKGDRLGLTGELLLDQWEDKNTQEKRYKHKLNVQSMVMLGSPGEGSGNQSGNSTRGYGPSSAGNGGGGNYGGPHDNVTTDIDDGEIPF